MLGFAGGVHFPKPSFLVCFIYWVVDLEASFSRRPPAVASCMLLRFGSPDLVVFFFFKFRFSTYLAMLFHVISCKFHFFYQGTKREVFQAEEQGMHLWAYMKKTSLSSGGHLQITEGQ